MLRTALKPQWLAVLAVVLLLATGMTLLGRWQLDRARQHGAQQSAQGSGQPAAAARPIAEVIPPRTTFPKTAVGAQVVAEGEWDAARAVLIPGRDRGGRPAGGPAGQAGFWVLVPLRMSDGSAVGIVRGWVATPGDPVAQAAASPAGVPVRVTGLLQPSEPPAERAPGQGTGLPPGQLPRVAIADLASAWPYPLVTGYVLAQQEQAVDGAQVPGPLPQRVLPLEPAAGLDWRNLGYAVQWWLFAGFGLFMWWRLVRDDHQTKQAVASS
jgi:cytochrome oxidase assembly protein ShyY1